MQARAGRYHEHVTTAQEHDWYAILEIPREATAAQVKAAHRRLARALHPDVDPSPGAHERMSLVNQARDVLLDPARRAAFDASRPYTRREPRPYTPAPPEARDWYEFLGVDPAADSSAIVVALRRKREWIRAQHFSDEDYTKQALAWREASETLTNPRSREAYDRARRRAFAPGGDRDAPPDWYAFLGVSRRADLTKIADRVTDLSRRPAPGPQFKRDLETAWRTLRDAETRAAYDARLGAGQAGEATS